MRFIPTRSFPVLSILVGWTLRYVIFFRRDIIVKNLELIFDKQGRIKPKNIVRDIYRHFGYLLLEIGKLATISKKQLIDITTIHNLDIFEKALEKKKGVIAITSHIGSWELSSAALAVRGFPLTPIVKNMRKVDNDYIYHQLRVRHGGGYVKKDKGFIRNIISVLKNNATLCMVLDQSTNDKNGVSVPFLGQKAFTYSQAAQFAKKMKCPIINLYAFRRKNSDHHDIYIQEVEIENIEEKSQEQITEEFASKISENILLNPSQWIWMHRRWKRG